MRLICMWRRREIARRVVRGDAIPPGSALANHLAVCAECARALKEFALLHQALPVRAPGLSADFEEKLRARLAARTPAPDARPAGASGKGRLVGAIAAYRSYRSYRTYSTHPTCATHPSRPLRTAFVAAIVVAAAGLWLALAWPRGSRPLSRADLAARSAAADRALHDKQAIALGGVGLGMPPAARENEPGLFTKRLAAPRGYPEARPTKRSFVNNAGEFGGAMPGAQTGKPGGLPPKRLVRSNPGNYRHHSSSRLYTRRGWLRERRRYVRRRLARIKEMLATRTGAGVRGEGNRHAGNSAGAGLPGSTVNVSVIWREAGDAYAAFGDYSRAAQAYGTAFEGHADAELAISASANAERAGDRSLALEYIAAALRTASDGESTGARELQKDTQP